MDLATWRAIELRHLTQTLKNEFARWRGLTDAGQPYEKHHTQVMRITRQLDAFLDAIGGPVSGSAAAFQTNERIYRALWFAHHVWAYFRERLVLRDVTWLKDDLNCADEFAYACYAPARDRAENAGVITAGDLKEPPLVFFTTEATPYAQARGTTLDAQGVTGRDVTDFARFSLQILTLPVPLVGVPWIHLDYLPSATVIAHEVGHAVERDFDLTPVLEAGIKRLGLPETRQTDWLAWSHELFADAYAALCVGPAFTLALMDYFVDTPAVIENEPAVHSEWGDYPPRFLRMLVNFELLKNLSLPDAGQEQMWRSAYKRHTLPAHEGDVAAVVGALLDSPAPKFGDLPVREVISFTGADLEEARKWASRLVEHGADPDVGMPFRRLFAAATLAYHDDPEAYQQADAQKPMLERMVAAIAPGQRGGLDTPSAIAEHLAGLELPDQEAGRKWLELFDAQKGGAFH